MARRRRVTSRHHRRRNPPKKRYYRHNARRRAGLRLFNPHRRRNPMYRHHRRHRRRNPEVLVLSKPGTYAPYLLTGALAASVTTLSPTLWGKNVTGAWAYATQAGVAIAGGLLAPFVVRDPFHGLVWFIVSGATILSDAIGKSVVGNLFGLARRHPAAMGAYAFDAPYYPTMMAPFRPALSGYGGPPYPDAGGQRFAPVFAPSRGRGRHYGG